MLCQAKKNFIYWLVMLLAKLCSSFKATFWSKRLKDGSPELLLASESVENSEETTLDALIQVPNNKLISARITLSDERIQDILDESGLEMNIEQASAFLANLLDEACTQTHLTFKEGNVSSEIILVLKHNGKVECEIELPLEKTCPEEGCSEDWIRVMSIFSREPRKDSKKRLSSTQTSSQQQEGEIGEAQERNVKRVKAVKYVDTNGKKGKKKLKL